MIAVATAVDYLGRLQRPDVSNQGTLRVVALIAGMAKLVDALVLGTSGQPWGFESLYSYQFNARLAQLVEHLVYTENVGGSSPSPGTSFGVCAM